MVNMFISESFNVLGRLGDGPLVPRDGRDGLQETCLDLS